MIKKYFLLIWTNIILKKLKTFIKRNYFVIFAIFSGIPIFFLPGSYWDAATLEYGFVKENLSGIEIWYREAGSYFQLVLMLTLQVQDQYNQK